MLVKSVVSKTELKTLGSKKSLLVRFEILVLLRKSLSSKTGLETMS